MDHMPDNIFDDLMLDMIQKYSGPQVTVANPVQPVLSQSQPPTPAKGQLARYGPAASSGTDRPKATSSAGHVGLSAWRAPHVVSPDRPPPRDAPSLGIDPKGVQENNFDDLMLNLIGKYSGPPVTTAGVDPPDPSEPEPQTSGAGQPRPPLVSAGSGQPRPPLVSAGAGQPRPPLVSASSGQPRPPLVSAGSWQPSPPLVSAGSGQPRPPLVSAGSGQPRPPLVSVGSGQPRPPLVSAGSGQPRHPLVSASSGQPRLPLVSAGSGQPRPPLVSASSGQLRPPLVSAGAGQPRPPLVSASSGQPRPPLVSARSGQPRPPLVSAGSGQLRPPLMNAGAGQPRPPLVSAGAGQPKPPLVSAGAGHPRPPLVSAGAGHPRPPLVSAGSGQPRPPLVSAGAGQPRPPLVSAGSGQSRPPLVSTVASDPQPQTHKVDSSGQRQLASDGSAASSGKKPQQNSSKQGPASLSDGSYQAIMKSRISSSTVLPGCSDSARGLHGGPAGTMDVASKSCSEASAQIKVKRPVKKKPPPAAYDFCLTKLDNVEHKNLFFQKCEAELVNWALRENVYRDADLSIVNAVTVRNLLMAFRIPLSADLQYQCFFSRVWVLFHSKFKALAMDRHIWDLLQYNRDPEAKMRFVRDVLPLDRKLEDIQARLINATTPLFGICNFLEQPEAERKQSAPALKDALCLCRESMIMCGQVFSAITVLRQESVLEQLHLHNKPPSPSILQNVETASLFGPDYMSELSSFITADKKTAAAPPATPRKEEDPKNMPAQINYKTKCAIDRLAEFVVEMDLETDSFNVDKMAKNPNFWFLAAKKSAAYKLYEKKLAEFRQKNLNSPASTPKALHPNPQGVAPAPEESLAQPLQISSVSDIPPQMDCFQLAPPPPKKSKPSNAVCAQAESSSPDEFPKVDAATRETAERLAKLVVEMGLEKLKSYMQKVLTNPTYWFLKQRDSEAYQYYQKKLRESHEAKKTLLLLSKQPPVQLKSGTV